MPKKKTNVKIKIKKKTKSSRPPNRSIANAVIERSVDQVCALSNPFCPAARTARWPDSSFVRSAPWSISGVPVPLTADANGSLAYLFSPYLGWQYSVGTVTGTSVAYATNGVLLSSIPPTVAQWRITSWGLKLNCSGSSQTTSGMVYVRGFTDQNGGAVSTTTITTTNADFSVETPAARLITKDMHFVPMPLGDSARLFQKGSLGGTMLSVNDQNFTWQHVQIGAVGLPANSTILTVTAYYNFELIYGDGAANQVFALPPKTDNPIVREANSNVLNKVGNIIEGAASTADSIFKSKAFKYISGALGYAFGGPAGAMLGNSAAQMIKDVD